MTVKVNNDLPSPFKKVVPESQSVGKDRLLMRLDFYSEAVVMQDFEKKGNGRYRMVDAYDIARAITNEISYDSGLLPPNTLWWANTKEGAQVALYVPAGVRRLALQEDAGKAPKRYDIPLPNLIFLCKAGHPPYVFAVFDRPTGLKDRVYKAPLANVYNDGRTCGGSHKYSANLGEIPDDFFKSFFSRGADLSNRSKKHPQDIIKMWQALDKKKEYPLLDLVYHGTIADIMRYRL